MATAETFRLEIASPERMLVNEAVTEATLPGEQGVLGILPGHAPLLSELGTGELNYTLVNGQRHFMAVQGGYIEISGNHVRVAASSAEYANEIDKARAETALKRATERVANPLPGVDIGGVERDEARTGEARCGEGRAIELSWDAGAGVERVGRAHSRRPFAKAQTVPAPDPTDPDSGRRRFVSLNHSDDARGW
jgi:F-type H+-transporting ATPase subunit epsilon